MEQPSRAARAYLVMRNFLIVGFCLAAAFASARVLLAERAAIQAAANAMPGGIPLGIDAPLPRPFSDEAVQLLARACAASLAPGTFDLLPPRLAETTLRNCADFTIAAADARPNAALSLAAASVALRKADVGAFMAALDAGHRAAPYQGWLAENRFVLLTEAVDAGILPQDWSGQAEAEIDTLLLTQSGAELLALHYLRGTELKPLIRTRLDLASPYDQQRLLNLVRQGLEG